jgi:hypothetical protein
MRPLLVALALSLSACGQEYDLGKTDTNKGPKDTETGEDPTGTGDTDPELLDCEDQVIPGYATGTDADCENEIEVGSFTPVVEWRKATWTTDPTSNQIMSTPIVAQLSDDDGDGDVDNDDIPDIIVVTYGSGSYSTNGQLRAVSGDGSAELWNVIGQGLQGTGGVAAGDIDGDGLVELVASTQTSIKAFEHDGTFKWECTGVSGHQNGISDTPSISDMDHDGNPEVLLGNAICSNTGTLLGAGSYGYGGPASSVGSASFAVDLDNDGTEELIGGNAVYDKTGGAIWYNSQIPGYPAVADFDGDGLGEVIVTGSAQIRLDDTDGTVLWSAVVPGSYGGPPTIADFDGDGEPEVGVASNNTYAVYDGDGTMLWSRTTDDSSSGNTGSVVFDFEGDGVAEAVYADQSRLWVYSGIDGAVKLESTEHSNATWMESPAIADVDGDDHAEIVVANTTYVGSHTGFYVFGDADNSWQPGRKVWNQHAYFITNVEDDGGIPVTADMNWSIYNNFRSADVTGKAGLSAPDLVVAQADLCEIDCDEGKLIAWVQAGNEGASDVAAGASINLYTVTGGVETLYESVTSTDAMNMGWYNDSVQFDIEGVDLGTLEALIVRVEHDSIECDDTNNEVRFDGPFCL